MVAFILSALATGFVVVFVLPFGRSILDKVPGIKQVTSNKLVQLIVVGGIVLAGLGLFGMLARRIRV